jgi:hypothetical protein
MAERGANFEHGHTPLSGYLAFAEERPAQATAREIYERSIPADTGMTRDEDGKLYRPLWGDKGMSPQQVMEHKYDIASKTGVKDDILKRGVVNPLRMVPDGATAPRKVYDEAQSEDMPNVPLLWNGQHRLAVMLKHSPDTPIPLEWGTYEDFENAGPRVNSKYNEKIPASEKPVTLPKAKKTAASAAPAKRRPVAKRAIPKPPSPR